MEPISRTVFAFALALTIAPVVAYAEAGATGYPTVDRVEFVLECMHKNGGMQVFLYKCSCLIDDIAQKYSYDDFVEASTAARYQTLGGERGGAFRDPPNVREMAKRYMQVQSEAMKHCGVPR